MKFTITPPSIMISLCQAGLLLNSQSCGSFLRFSVSKLSSTIPEIFTYPPSGSAPIPYSVSPIFFLNNENGQSKNR